MSRLQTFRSALAAGGFDAAIVSDKRNQRYLSDFDFDDGLVLVTMKNAYLLTDFRYEEAARAQVKGMEVVLPKGGQLDCVRALLTDDGCTRVVFEEAALSYASYARYCEVLKDFTVIGGASPILDEMRLYKDDAELDAIARAQAITDAAFSHILNWIKPEMTEIEVALELEYFMRRNGAEALAFDTIAVSGTNSARPHGVPRHVRLEKGFLTMDYGARVDGYCSDMTRTVVLGRADAEMKKLYNTVLTAQRSALDAACEGAHCRELDRIARDIINGAGYEGCFGHSLGHGVGLYVHEDPRLSAKNTETILTQGHVVTVEPGIYLEGKYGCRIEDLVVIEPAGIKNLTKSKKELIEIL